MYNSLHMPQHTYLEYKRPCCCCQCVVLSNAASTARCVRLHPTHRRDTAGYSSIVRAACRAAWQRPLIRQAGPSGCPRLHMASISGVTTCKHGQMAPGKTNAKNAQHLIFMTVTGQTANLSHMIRQPCLYACRDGSADRGGLRYGAIQRSNMSQL